MVLATIQLFAHCQACGAASMVSSQEYIGGSRSAVVHRGGRHGVSEVCAGSLGGTCRRGLVVRAGSTEAWAGYTELAT